MKKIILIYFIFFSFNLSYASEYIKKYDRYFKGIGTVKLIMINNKYNVEEKHKLILENEKGEKELIWETSIAKKCNNIKPVNIYKYSQIVDIFMKKRKCSFLISTTLGVKYIALIKEDKNWIVKTNIIVDEISNNMKLEKIKLINFNLILTKNKLGQETIYKIENNGIIKKYVEQNYKNKNIKTKEIIIN